MEQKLKSDLAIKWMQGMKIAFERMVLYKYRNHQSMVISTDEGIKVISGEELKKYMTITPIIGSSEKKTEG